MTRIINPSPLHLKCRRRRSTRNRTLVTLRMRRSPQATRLPRTRRRSRSHSAWPSQRTSSLSRLPLRRENRNNKSKMMASQISQSRSRKSSSRSPRKILICKDQPAHLSEWRNRDTTGSEVTGRKMKRNRRKRKIKLWGNRRSGGFRRRKRTVLEMMILIMTWVMTNLRNFQISQNRCSQSRSSQISVKRPKKGQKPSSNSRQNRPKKLNSAENMEVLMTEK